MKKEKMMPKELYAVFTEDEDGVKEIEFYCDTLKEAEDSLDDLALDIKTNGVPSTRNSAAIFIQKFVAKGAPIRQVKI